MQMAAYVAPQSAGDTDSGEAGPGLIIGTAENKDLFPADIRPVDRREPASEPVSALDAREITTADQKLDFRAAGKAAPREEDETCTAIPNDSAWKDSLRQNRGAGSRVAPDQMKSSTVQQPGQATPAGQQAGLRREQQIMIEERNGQSFVDPAERVPHHRHGLAAEDPHRVAGFDNDLDMGM